MRGKVEPAKACGAGGFVLEVLAMFVTVATSTGAPQLWPWLSERAILIVPEGPTMRQATYTVPSGATAG